MPIRHPPHSAALRSVWPHPISIVLFAIGAALGLSFLRSPFPQSWTPLALATIVCTGTWLGSGLRAAPSAPRRWLGRACWVALTAFYVLWIYLAVALGTLLAWTVSQPMWVLTALATVAALATAARRRERFHVPFVLPLGIWIVTIVSGWPREERLIRCDDFLALRAPVELVVPTPNLASCQPGEVRPAGRFARTVWEAPDGERVVFTTQGDPVPDGLSGSVCEGRLGTGAVPTCVGPPTNKAQGLIDLVEQDRLLIMQWGIRTTQGATASVILELPRSGPLTVLAEHWFDESVGEGFYEPRNSTLYMFSDWMDGIRRAVLPSFEQKPMIPIRFAPGEIHYDTRTGEGVACGSPGGAAVRGEPFAFRYFHAGNGLLQKVSLTWGCDWDPASRSAYIAVPNLGLLLKLDYDTGRVAKRWFIGVGKRSVAYDRARQRVYMTDFLRGEVVVFDEPSERMVERWFVGRFSRWVRLTRDGRALLATGNLGIVRIPLERAGRGTAG